ncbi:hypothetical protein XENOCAPTIV_030519 [Xenoophorus captivus]|uniref:Uncharacterized protein n=1 Tax=Xenoophorus captivus TaxID=1517983 RepID=A0ABV0RN03_9TELE
MFLDCGRKLEYLERTHACTGRTCKLHAERAQPGVEPRTFLQKGNSATNCATVLPHLDVWLHLIKKTLFLASHDNNKRPSEDLCVCIEDAHNPGIYFKAISKHL